jgi:hypothetical protein
MVFGGVLQAQLQALAQILMRSKDESVGLVRKNAHRHNIS